MYDNIIEAVEFITGNTTIIPKTGIVLGTGLSGLADKIDNPEIIPYEDIPHMPRSTVKSHRGNLILGTIHGRAVAALQGRFHYYEGYSLQEIGFPIRILKFLGIDSLIISNAAGGLKPEFTPGNIVLVKDHINLLGANPLRGFHDDRFGNRFPDLLNCYDKAFMKKVMDISNNLGIPVKKGVYLAVQGPSLETHAEHLFFRTIGADLVGMSTVPESIVARQMDIRVVVFSVVTNQCLPNAELIETSLEDVIAVANKAEPNLTKLIFSFINSLNT